MRFITTFNNLFLLLDEQKYWPQSTLKIQLQIKDLTNNEKPIWNTYGRLCLSSWLEKKQRDKKNLSIVETYFPFSRYFSFGLFNSIDGVLHTITSDEKWFFFTVLYVAPPPFLNLGCSFFNLFHLVYFVK